VERIVRGKKGRRDLKPVKAAQSPRNANSRENIPGEEPLSAPSDDPDGMHEARDVPQQGKQEVDPELRPDAFLKKDTERRKNDGEENAKEVGRVGGRSHGGVV